MRNLASRLEQLESEAEELFSPAPGAPDPPFPDDPTPDEPVTGPFRVAGLPTDVMRAHRLRQLYYLRRDCWDTEEIDRRIRRLESIMQSDGDWQTVLQRWQRICDDFDPALRTKVFELRFCPRQRSYILKYHPELERYLPSKSNGHKNGRH